MTKTLPEEGFEKYLRPTWFIDSDEPSVVEFARQAVGAAKDDREKGVRLFYAVRDGIRYNPYDIDLTRRGLKASVILARREGYCVAKAVVLAAAARAVAVPSRLGFADVRNHLTTERLRTLMNTDVFIYHGYTELFLNGRWVKATPTFNLSLCERFGVKPLEFDGLSDTLFHEFDSKGNRHMEYVNDRGTFADLPYETIVESFRTHYPGFFKGDGTMVTGNFEKEALEDRGKA